MVERSLSANVWSTDLQRALVYHKAMLDLTLA
jgi:hypothetical protein